MASKTGKGRTFWTPVVAEFEQTSGLTQAAFAKTNGVRIYLATEPADMCWERSDRMPLG
jgi:hypothetical protein